MQRSESIAELAKALAAAQGEIKPVARTKKNPYFDSMYADLADICAAVAPVTSKHGLAVTQWPEWDKDTGRLLLTTMLTHASGEWLQASFPLLTGKGEAQAVGSAITYSRRYNYGSSVNVATDDDDDGNKATEGVAPSRSARPASPRAANRPPADDQTGELAPAVPLNETFEERRARIIAEARAKGPLEERAEQVQATQRRTRAAPRPPQPPMPAEEEA
jgi:ERF superfamily